MENQTPLSEELLDRLKSDVSSLQGKNDELQRRIDQVLSSRRYRLAESLARLSQPLAASRKIQSGSVQMLRLLKRQVKAALGIQKVQSVASAPGTQFIPVYQIFSRPGTYSECIFGWRGDDYPMSHRDLLASTAAEFTIQPLEQGFLGIHIMLGTHGRNNTCSVTVEVFDAETEQRPLLASSVRSAEDLLDNQLNYFPFSPAVTGGKKKMLIRISSTDAQPGNCIALWGNSVPVSVLKRSRSELKDCINFYDHSRINTAYLSAPRDESFFPRFTASSCRNSVVEYAEGWRGVCFNTSYTPLYPGSSAELTFFCSRNDLSKIVVSLCTFCRTNQCSISTTVSRLLEGKWVPIHQQKNLSQEIADNAPFIIEFGPVYDSANEWFRCEFHSDDATPTNCLGIQGTSVGRATEVYRRLKHSDKAVSMVDSEITLANLESGADDIPDLNKLASPIEEKSFGTLVAIDDRAPAAVFERFSHLKQVRIRRVRDLLLDMEPAIGSGLIILFQLSAGPECEILLQVARRSCIPTVLIPSPEANQPDFKAISAVAETKVLKPAFDMEGAADFLEGASGIESETGRLCYLPARPEERDLYALYQRIYPAYRAQRLPSISIISILYSKEAEILTVLESIKRQDYAGEIEIVLVDDCSPDKSRELVEKTIAEQSEVFGPKGRMPIRLLLNEKNTGNCGSRNRALEAARGDIVLIIDADCVLNSACLRTHAYCHGNGDVDVVAGTHNLETNHRDAFEALKEFEQNPLKAQQQAQLQDATVPQSFLNLITRNVSIRRSIIKGPLFDELFAYSKDPESGFGWEDVEMGYRLYKQGARIRFNNRAISVHISHPSSCREDTKPARSVKNFRRLLEKHPELCRVSRRWVIDTFYKICQWMENSGITENADRAQVEYLLRGDQSLRHVYNPQRELRIVSYRWHCPHQYEIYKMPHQFRLLKGIGPEYTNAWAYEQRPLLPNVKLVPTGAIDFREFDLAILHFDENVLFSENTNGILGHDWGLGFQWLRENANLPMAAICHGTPQFRGQYDPTYLENDLGQVLEYERKRLVDYCGDIPVVCNSYQAQAEWKFNNSRVIWQGFDPMEFGPAAVGHGILTLGEAMRERPLYRGYYLFEKVRALLPEDINLTSLKVARPAFDYHSSGNEFAYAKFRKYNQAIRNHSIYFNPTIRSPMPRSRGEAMMSGLVSVSANNHDVSLFIKNGINGFYSNDPVELADYLEFLVRNEVACRAMGAKSRALASDVFNIDRFHRDWRQLITDLGV